MSNKKYSYFFLMALLLILFFILGVRYGQRVEKTNKTIDYLLRLTPSISPTTQPTPPTTTIPKPTSQSAQLKNATATPLFNK